MQYTLPEVFHEVVNARPFKRYILPSGAMNLLSSIHLASDMPHVQGDFFVGDGNLIEEWASCRHTYIAIPANICVHCENSPDNLLSEKVQICRQFARPFRRCETFPTWKTRVYCPHARKTIRCNLPFLHWDKYIRQIIFLQRLGDVVVHSGKPAHKVLSKNSTL